MAVKGNKGWQFIAIGAAVMIGLAVFAAFALNKGHKADPKMNDGQTGITIDIADATASMDSKKPLRCYVNGADAGELTLAECAKKNGVATGALDVGLDDNGNVAAAPTGSLAPVPVAPASAGPTVPGTPVKPVQTPEPTAEVVPDTQVAAGPTDTCLRYNSNTWNRLSDNLTLGQCVKLLYDGRCVNPGNASYGRWGGKTLRLVPRRVEISDDNSTFRTLVEQGQGCSVPTIK